MDVDYDAPRRTDSDESIGAPLYALQERDDVADASIEIEESDQLESFELPGADLSGERLEVDVIPRRADEFVCASCFLVYHRSRLSSRTDEVQLCLDCV